MQDDKLLNALTCPQCRDSDLIGIDAMRDEGEVVCEKCGSAYPVRNGIPILLPPDVDLAHVHDELDHGQDQKRRQVEFFDRQVAEEFAIERPHNTPRVYRSLMAEKFQRSVAHLPRLTGSTVLDACCGSGMEAEYLVQRGARVIALDVSEGCANRAKARAERHGVDYLVVVGDVERLPIRSRGVDIGYVHDGLHHLEEPRAGIRELARVARRAVSVNEPAAAFGTQLAVALGISENVEISGNRVARLRADHVRKQLTAAGFESHARRYLMYYSHQPGRFTRAASHPAVYPLYRGAHNLTNMVAGRWGNKLQVTGVRKAA